MTDHEMAASSQDNLAGQPGNEISYKSELIRSSKKHLWKFLDTTTVAGIKFVFVGKSTIRRIAWGVIFFCCTVGCIANIAVSFKRFLDIPTATTIKEMPLDAKGLAFPAVTFCDLNRVIDYSNPLDTFTDDFLHQFFQADVDNESQTTRPDFVNKCMNDFITSINGTPIEGQDIWQFISTSDFVSSNFTVSCGFSHEPFADSDCKDELEQVMIDGSVCYTFNGIRNGKPDVYMKYLGSRYGLQVELNINGLDATSVETPGVLVVVHKRDYIPRPRLFGIGIYPGSRALITVKKHFKEDRTVPGCIDNFYLPFFHDMAYSKFACNLNARSKITTDVCGCVIFTPIRPTSGPYASVRNCTFNDSCCLIKAIDIADNMTYDCPPVCSSASYTHTLSYVGYPAVQRLDKLVDQFNVTADSVKKNFLSFNVFLEDLVVTKSLTEYTYQWNAFLADVGGHLGLFIGASIITVFEVAIFGMDMLKNILFPHKIKKHIKHIDKRMSLLKVDVVDDNGGSNGGSNAGSVEQLNGSTVQAIN
jgi:hypothetical protein